MPYTAVRGMPLLGGQTFPPMAKVYAAKVLGRAASKLQRSSMHKGRETSCAPSSPRRTGTGTQKLPPAYPSAVRRSFGQLLQRLPGVRYLAADSAPRAHRVGSLPPLAAAIPAENV